MDVGLVVHETRSRCAEGVLHSRKPAWRSPGRQLRPLSAEHPDSAQGVEGRIASVRAELLPPLSTRGSPCRADRYFHEPCRIPLREEDESSGIAVSPQGEEGA